MEDKGVFVGTDTFTSNSEGSWFDDTTFTIYYGEGEVRELRNCYLLKTSYTENGEEFVVTDESMLTEEQQEKLKELKATVELEKDVPQEQKTVTKVQFYQSDEVYQYKRDDWDALHDAQSQNNEDAINEIYEDIIPNLQ